jgi:hypothetical protein
MAIAYDATAHGYTVSDTSITFSHTTGTGSDRILWVGVRTGDATDRVTGVTYNSVSMTQAIKKADASGSQYIYLYYLVNPASGAHDVVVTLGSSQSIIAISASYSGASQINQPDSTADALVSPGTSITTNTTVVGSACWVLGFIANNGTLAMTASTGVGAVRDNGSFAGNVTSLGDSNANVSAGSYGMTWTSSSQNMAQVLASFSQTASGGGILLFM